MSRTMQTAAFALLAVVPCLAADSASTVHVTDSPARNRRFAQETRMAIDALPAKSKMLSNSNRDDASLVLFASARIVSEDGGRVELPGANNSRVEGPATGSKSLDRALEGGEVFGVGGGFYHIGVWADLRHVATQCDERIEFRIWSVDSKSGQNAGSGVAKRANAIAKRWKQRPPKC